MQSLQDLNTYGNTIITFDDDRPAEVVFDRTTPTTQTLDLFENQQVPLPNGIEISEIIDPDSTLVEYIIDATGFAADVEVVFGTLPSGVTVVESPTNYWTVSGIDNLFHWNAVKNPDINFDFGTTGTGTITTTIEYTIGGSRLTKDTTINVTITEIDYLDAGDIQTFSAYEDAFSPTDTPLIIADTSTFNPLYTLTISPSITTAIESMSVTTPDSAVFTATTDTLVINGEKDEINASLATLSIDFTGINQDFYMTYTLTNDLNSNVDVEIQGFLSYEFAAEMVSNSTMTGAFGKVHDGSSDVDVVATISSDLHRLRFADSNVQAIATIDPTPNAIFSGNATATMVGSISARGISNAWIDPLITSDSFYANTDDQSIVNPPTLETEFETINNDWTVQIGPDALDTTAIGAITEIATSSTQPTASYNASTATLTLVGTASEIQDALDNLTVSYNNNLQTDYDLYFTAEFNNNGVEYTYVHTMTYDASIDAPNGTYQSNINNTPFDIFDIVEPGYTTWSITLSVDTGNINDSGSLTTSITVSGTESQVEAALAALEYYPDYNQNSTVTITYTSTKDGKTSTNGTAQLTFTSAGSIGNTLYLLEGTNNTYTPSIKEYLYGQMSYAIVGGGGGAAYPYIQSSSWTSFGFDSDVHSITNNGNVSKDTSVYKLSALRGTSASGRFPGNTNDYLSWTDTNIGTNEPLLDNISFYFRLDSVTGTQVLFEKYKSSTGQYFKVQTNGDDLEVTFSDGTNTVTKTNANSLTVDTWHHFWWIADFATISGSSGKRYGIYLDGTRFALDNTTYLKNSGGVLWDNTLGADSSGSNLITGYIDEFCTGPALFDLYDSGTFYDPPSTLTVPGQYKFANETQMTNTFFMSYWNDNGDGTWSAGTEASHDVAIHSGNGGYLHINFADFDDFDEIIDDRNEFYRWQIEDTAMAGFYTVQYAPTGGGGQITIVENDSVTNTTYTATLGAAGLSGSIHKRQGSRGGTSTFRSSTALGGFGAEPKIDANSVNDVYYYETSNGISERSAFAGLTGKGGDYGGYNDGNFTGGQGGDEVNSTFPMYHATGGGPGDAFTAVSGTYEDGYDNESVLFNVADHPLPMWTKTFNGQNTHALSGSGTPAPQSQYEYWTYNNPPTTGSATIDTSNNIASGLIYGKGADSDHTKGQPGAVSIVIHPK